MQGGLSVEYHDVTIDDMSFDAPAKLQVDVASTFMIPQIDPFAGIANDVFGARVFVRHNLSLPYLKNPF
jgi:hypothetical protein